MRNEGLDESQAGIKIIKKDSNNLRYADDTTLTEENEEELKSLLMTMKVKVTQSCPSLCDLMDYTVHGILQTRILERVAFPFSRGSSQPMDQTQVSRIAGGFFTSWATKEALRVKEESEKICLKLNIQKPRSQPLVPSLTDK